MFVGFSPESVPRVEDKSDTLVTVPFIEFSSKGFPVALSRYDSASETASTVNSDSTLSGLL